MASLKESHVGATTNIVIFLYVPLLKVSVPPILNMGMDLEEWKINLFPIGKIVELKNTLREDSTIYLHHPHLSILQIMEYQNLLVPWRGLHGCMMKILLLCRQSLKHMCKVVHHFIPLSCKGFLEQHFKRISCSIIFLFVSACDFFYGLDVTNLAKDRLVRVPTSCTQILSGTCKKKNKWRADLLWCH